MSEIEVFYPKNVTEWRNWLEQHHQSKQAVWVVFHAKASGKPTISWSESVDVALCYGWIDSKKIKVAPDTSHQFFSRRKPNSTWSKINKQKVEHLATQGIMTEAGFAVIEIAKQNGSWFILDEVEELIIPQDLETQLQQQTGTLDAFLSFSKSKRKQMLSWLVFAKRPETRQKRINEILEICNGKKFLR